jgi:hypothetical protein
MAENNVFQRYTNTDINLENRVGEIGEPGGANYSLTLTLTPELIELNREVGVRLKALRNGLPLANQQIFITSSDQLIGLVPDTIFTDENGEAAFGILSLAVGSAELSATMTVSGVTYESNVVTLTVFEFQAPENYDATGYGKITFSVEPMIADAVMPRVQRLSDAEQTRKYPGDTGLFHAHWFANATVTFIPKSMLTT